MAELATRPVRAILAGVRDPGSYEPPPIPDDGAREIRPVAMDLSSREAIDRSVDALGDDLDAIGLLVNNAGRMTGGLLEEQDVEDVYAMFQVNLLAVAHLTARVLPGMVRRGARQGRQQRVDQRLRVLPGGEHVRGVQGGRRRAQRVAAPGARRDRGVGAAPRHPGRAHRHARRDRGGLRPPHGHLRLAERRAGRVGTARREGDRGRQAGARAGRPPRGSQAHVAGAGEAAGSRERADVPARASRCSATPATTSATPASSAADGPARARRSR